MKNKNCPNHKTIYKLIFMIGLVLIFKGMLAQADEIHKQKQTNLQDIDGKIKEYPPYPDVWDWQVPKRERPAIGFEVYAMDHGDVMISYHQGDISGPFRTFSFFGRTEVKDYNAVFKDDDSNRAKSRIPFKGDTILWTTGGGWRSGGCFDALDYHITMRNKTDEKLLMSKTLLYIFDNPARYETHPHCMNGHSFNYQVAAVAADFLRLKDGTFLLSAHVQDNAYVIRFDENFQTKSKLINNKFFWMDTDALRKFDAKYGDRAVGDKKLKQLYADLYKLLMDVRRRESK